MAIKKLEIEEIKNIMKEIEELKNNDYYKFYFDETSENFPDEAYMINGYYVDFTFYHGVCFMGVIRLGDKVILGYYELMKLIKNRIKKYKTIYLWSYLENKLSIRFHLILINKFGATQKIVKNISLIELREELL